MLAEDTIEIQIAELIAESVLGMGYEIVRVRMQGSSAANSLQIMIERADGKLISVEDCEKVSVHVSALLDVEEPIGNAYNLEISSPGVDRPLTRLKDFVKYQGFEIKLETKAKIDGQAKFRGLLAGLDGEDVLMDLNLIDISSPDKQKRVKISFNNVKNAKLVLNDALMEAFTKMLECN